jgi:Ca2+-binding RTX toxin-like protein
MPGRLQVVDGPGGTLLIQRVDGAVTEDLFRVTLNGASAVVEGLNSAAGLGTDTVVNTEQLHFIFDNPGGAFDPNRFVSVSLAPTQYGEWVTGSEAADTIRLADYPGAIGVDAGRGDDTLLGDGAGNFLTGGAGSDRIDGGGGHDVAAFQLAPGTTGSLRLVEGSGAEAGRFLVQRVDGAVVETVFVVTIDGANATATVTGVNSAARLGTDTVTNVEDLHFFVQNSPPGGAFVNIPLAPYVPALANGFAHVGGSYVDDRIDLAALYPGAPVTANLNAHGGHGQDLISGHAGSNWMDGGAGDDVLRGLGGQDTLHGGAGRDTLEGGAGDDRLHGEGGDDVLDGGEGGNDVAAYVLPQGTPGTLRLVDGTGENAGKLLVQRVDGATVETLFVVTLNGTTATVVGVNSAAHHGTDVVTGVEEMHFFVQNDVFNPNQFANIRLAPDQYGDFVSGSEIGDVINLADYPGAVSADGGRGDDIVTGTEASNLLRGGAGADALFGLGGADSLFGGGGNDVLDGGEGNDTLLGEGGADILRGGAGDDLLRGGAGVDRFEGGEGFDRISFYEPGATSGVVVDLRTGVVSNDGFGNVESLTSIEGLGAGTRFADTFYGNDEANFFFGGSGDTLEGFGGADRFMLGGAPALVDGGAGVDEVERFQQTRLTDLNGDGIGEEQTTTAGVHVDLGRQLIVNDGFGGSGIIRNIENLGGSEGADLLVGDAGANMLTGYGGDDRLEGGAGVDTARYFGARSQYVVSVSADGTLTVSGPEGVDTLVGIEQVQFADQTLQLRFGAAGADVLIGGAGGDVLVGLAGDDSLRGMEGADQLLGGDGADFLVGGAGDDLMDGGAGFDRAAFSSGATRGVTVDLRLQGTAQDTGQGMDTLVNIENVSGTRFNDVITGDEGSNWLWGGSDGSGVTGDDVISAGGGDDLVEVGTGNHTLDGGAGADALSLYGNQFDITAAGVTLSLALQGSAQATGQGSMILTGFENLSGSIHGDRLTGDGAANVIGGGGGADVIEGGGGNDLLLGDGMFVQSGGAPGSTGAFRLVDDANVTFGHAAGADTLRGGEGDDTLFGGRGDDVLDGGAGTDTARYAGLRADYVVTDLGGGRYTVSGPEGTDTLTAIEALQFSDQTVQLRPPGEVYVGGEGADVRDGGVWDDQLSGRGGADLLRGNAGDDQLFGDGGDDRLIGGAGDDRLNGGDGDDLLRGGSGVDRFDGGAGRDRVSFYDLGATQGVIADLRTQTIVNDGFGNTETMISIEDLGAGTVFADTFYGDDGANFIYGGGGDIIFGFGGNDSFFFGDGPALLDGGDGIDTIEGFNRIRTHRLATAGSWRTTPTSNGVHVNLATERLVDDGWGGSGVIRNVENVTGTWEADILIGDARANVLSGLEGQRRPARRRRRRRPAGRLRSRHARRRRRRGPPGHGAGRRRDRPGTWAPAPTCWSSRPRPAPWRR